MNINTQHPQNGSGTDTFCMSNFRDWVEKNFPIQSKDGNKRECPNCGAIQFQAFYDPRNTDKYRCFNCGTKEGLKKIAYKIMEGAGNFNKAPNEKLVTSQKLRQTRKVNKTNNNKNDSSKINNPVDSLAFIKEIWGDNLGWNLRTLKLTLSSIPLLADTIHVKLAEDYGVSIGKDLAISTALYLGQQNEYDPVKEYLLRCIENPTTNTPLETIAQILFGKLEPLYIEYFKRWAIGTVARVFHPGLKFDETLVLKGATGLGKSTLFRILSNGFFTDSMGNVEKADEIRKLHKSWICEWAELDKMTAKIYYSTIKGFLSKQDDEIRLPYARDLLTLPRRSVIVGTTNENAFLSDPHGNRRFWIIPIEQKINLDAAETIRDDLWASAYAAWINDGVGSHHLPEELWAAQAEDNLQYMREDPWDFFLDRYLEGKTEVNLKELFDELEEKLGQGSVRRARTDEMRLSDRLSANGWERKRVRRNGKRTWVYQCPQPLKG